MIEFPLTGFLHGAVTANVACAISAFVRQHRLGRAVISSGFVLESQPDTVRGPDVAFVRKERLPAGGLPCAFFTIPPDLAVEVVSPSDTAGDMEMKVQDYLRNGAQRMWVVYPDTGTVVVYRADGTARFFTGDEVIEDADFLPGFSLPLAEVFGD